MVRVGVVLSGCGVMDGSEIHEAVLTLLALDRAGVEAVCMAPNVAQRDVVDHLTNEPQGGQTRNCLVEAARIARGAIRDLAEVKASDCDAFVFPGGYGAAKNLCDFAVAGAEARVHPEAERLLREAHAAGKPIGAVCIAPATVAAALRGTAAKPILTIGTDAETAKALEAMGARHVPKPVREIAVDRENRIVSTPAYMLATRISEAAEGIEKLVREVLALVPKAAAARS